MDIRSAYNSGATALQDASAQMNNASSRIAQENVAKTNTPEDGDAVDSLSTAVERTPISLTTELVNLKVADFQAKSAAKVITTADEALGTLINTSV